MDCVKSGEEVGSGSAINVEIGWIPDFVQIYNATDGDIISCGFPNRWAIPFSSGGTNTLAAGDRITGRTSLATAIIKRVLLASGSWAGGDAAGFFIIERDTLVGTFQSENVIGTAASATDDATVTANVVHGYKIDTATAGVTTTSLPTAYVGAAGSNAKGFTIPSVVSEAAKLLRWVAFRNDE